MAGLQRRIAFTAFFMSGASSLVFQTLWSRLLSHVFGSSSIAISSVVSVFMAGLGLGAFLFGRRADRIADPLRVYALAETGVGCAALVLPWFLRADGPLAAVNATLRNSFGAESATFMFARFACIVPVLLVPTVLMGSTLPLLARHVVVHESSAALASREVGRLYAINTFGAVIGVLLGSFVLMPRLGVSTTNTVAASMNFLLALIIVALRALSAKQPAAASGAALAPAAAESPVAEGATAPHHAAWAPHVRKAAALAFALSGFASLLYEVVWSRALINTIGGSVYAFALILTTFLVGIAGGSSLGASLGSAEGRPLWPAAGLAMLLSWIAVGPILAHAGVSTALGVGAACLVVLVAWTLLARAQAARDQLFDPSALRSSERKSALSVLMVPCALALVVWLAQPDRLSRIALVVVVAISVFLVLLLTLRSRPVLLLIGLQLFVAASAWTSDLFADELSLTFASMVAPLYDQLPNHVVTVQAFMFATAALCVLPSALGMGAVFPITLRIWTSGGEQIGKDVGIVYTGNTLGSILGAWLPGFVLMPWLGMQATLHVGIASNLLIALALSIAVSLGQPAAGAAANSTFAAFSRAERGALAGTALLVPWLIALLCLVTLRPPERLAWNISKMTLGAFRISLARDVLDEESWGAPDLVYYHDGLSTTVTVERWGRHFSLKNNGKVDASNGDDMPTQIMVAALPLLMHAKGPRGLDVAIVGFGSGVTVGAALQFPVRSVHVVELERSIAEASRFFVDVNHLSYTRTSFPYVQMPRLQVINDDGRNYLAATPLRFDVIVSEPSNPWLTGVSDLFTVDHFRISKRKLKPGGIYCQWAQLYEISPENVKIIYRTFASQFRNVVVFSAEDLSSDTVLIGSDDPLPLDLDRVRRAFAEPRVVDELERAYVHSPFDVFARVLLADRQEVLRFTRGAPINSDDNARIELAAPRDLIGFERYKGYLETMYAPRWPYAHVAPRLTGFGTGAQASQDYAQQALALLSHGRKAQAGAVLQAGAAYGAGTWLSLVQRIYNLLGREPSEPTPAFASDATPSDVTPALRELLQQSWTTVQAGIHDRQYTHAIEAVERVPARLRHDLGGDWAYAEAYLLYKTHDPEDAVDLLEDLVRDEPGFVRGHPELYYFLARAHDAQMHFDKGVRNMRVYAENQAAGVLPDPPP